MGKKKLELLLLLYGDNRKLYDALCKCQYYYLVHCENLFCYEMNGYEL